jgi:serine protease Do
MKKTALLLILFLMMNPLQSGDTISKNILKAREKVFPALVHIQPIKEIFSSGEKRKVRVTGSGVIISPDGYVLTNNHVAEKAQYLRCTLSSHQELEAKIVGLDAWTDLALLKLDLEKAGLKKVPYAKLGDSDKLQVGQIVLALGSPLGLSRSLSMGVVSSIDRYFEDMGDMVSPYNLWIQTDAAINPGNSGGPLVNLDGEVIGINSRAMIFGENLGFAIPIKTAKSVIKQIMKNGKVERTWIGIDWQEIREYRKYIGNKNLEGVLIANVVKNSPAEKAGLKPGYLVTKINGEKVSAVYREELPKIRLLISEFPIKQTITMTILDNGNQREYKIITKQQGKISGKELQCDEWGISVEEITPHLSRNFQLERESGVLISGVRRGSSADEAKIQNGNIIVSIDDFPVDDLDAFEKKYNEIIKEKGGAHLLRLKTGKINYFAIIKGGNDE